MTLADIDTLLDFHYWARDRMLDALDSLSPEQFTRDLSGSFRSVRDTAAHIYAAEWIWYQRWRGHSPTALVSSDQFPDVATLRRTWTELEPDLRAFVTDLGDEGIDRVLAYTLLNGTPGASPVWQMIQHVVNHASYHRGQVGTLLRQLDAPPLRSTDMITFYRERA